MDEPLFWTERNVFGPQALFFFFNPQCMKKDMGDEREGRGHFLSLDSR